MIRGYFRLYKHRPFSVWTIAIIALILILAALYFIPAPQPAKQVPQSPIQNQIDSTERLVAVRQTLGPLNASVYQEDITQYNKNLQHSITTAEAQLSDERYTNGSSPLANSLSRLLDALRPLEDRTMDKKERIYATREVLALADRLIADADPAGATHLAPRNNVPSLPQIED